MNGAVKKAEEILKENAGFFMAEQFKNQANVKIHRETTGPEIVEAIHRSAVPWMHSWLASEQAVRLQVLGKC